MITALESMPLSEIAALLATLTEERDAARRIIEDAETAIRGAGIIATGTPADCVRVLAAERDQAMRDREAAIKASNAKSDRLEEAGLDIERLATERDTLRDAFAAAEAERDALRTDVRRLARMVARLVGAP